MGNLLSCWKFDQPDQPTPPPPPPPVEISDARIDDPSQLQPLIDYIDRLLDQCRKQGRSSAPRRISTISASKFLTDIRLNKTANISTKIDGVLGKVDSMRQKEIQILAGNVLEAAGTVHWIGLAFSVIASVLERISMAPFNYRESIKLLEKMTRLAKHLLDVNRLVSEGVEDINGGCVRSIVDAAITCCLCIHQGKINGAMVAYSMQASLKEVAANIDNVYQDLSIQILKRLVFLRPIPRPADLLADIDPNIDLDDIQYQVRAVVELLDVHGTAAATAVNIYGFGGSGKTTLAKIVTAKLDLTGYAFSFIKMDQQSKIPRIQNHILHHLTGQDIKLTDDDHGQRELSRVFSNQSNFICIDNVVRKEDLEKLLPNNFSSGGNKLRILLTSPEDNLTGIHYISCRPYKIELLSEETSKRFLRRKILQRRGVSNQDITAEELAQIDARAVACGGVPQRLNKVAQQLRHHGPADLRRS